MKAERTSWAILSSVLAIALIFTYNRYENLRSAFLVRNIDSAYVDASLRLFSKEQGLNKRDIDSSYYVGYAGMSDRSCIRFVPKPNVTGGASTFCFASNDPGRLVSRDVSVE